MELKELSEGYRESAQAISRRILELRMQENAASDEVLRCRLRRRILELQPLRQQCTELGELTKRYYERGFYRNGKYTV